MEFMASHQWFLDTGASNHATPDPFVMSSTVDYTGSDTLRVGNGTSLHISSIGSASVATSNRIFRMSDVLYVPWLSTSLWSIHIQKFEKDNNVFFLISF